MQLTVNNQNVDIEGKVAVTFQVADIASTKDIKVTHTNNIKAPITKNNKIVFEDAEVVQSSGTAPYRKLPCQLKGRSDLLVNGTLILDNADGDYYNLQVYAGNKGFFEAIGDKTIKDIDLSDLTHFRNFNTIRGSRHNTDGYIYAFINHSVGNVSVSGTDTVNVENLLPSVFVHDLISRIAEAVDYTLTGEIFTAGTELNNRLKSLIIPCLDIKAGEGLLLAEAHSLTSQTGIFFFIDFEIETHDPQETLFTGGAMQHRNINYTFVLPGFTPFVYNSSGWTYRAYYAGKYTFEITVNYSWFKTAIAGAYGIAVHRGTTGSYTIVEGVGGGVNVINASHTFTLENLPLAAGEDVFIVILSVDGNFTLSSADFKVTKVTNAVSDQFGTYYDVAANLPNIKQKDLIKTVLAMVAGVCQSNSITGEMELFSTEELEENKHLAVDITPYIVDEKESTSFKLSGYGQKTWYKYKEDDTVASGYGDGYIDVDDETLPLEATQIELPFAATESNPRFNGAYECPEMAVITDFTADVITEIGKVEPRILFLEKSQDLSVTYSAPTTASSAVHSDDIPLCFFHDTTKTFNLHFLRLIDLYYNTIKRMLSGTKVHTKQVMWPEHLLNELDFKIPVYSNKEGQMYFINKIENFTGGKTKTILIRM